MVIKSPFFDSFVWNLHTIRILVIENWKIYKKVFLTTSEPLRGSAIFWKFCSFLAPWGSPGALLRGGPFFIFILFDSTSLPCCNEGLITSLWLFFVKLWSYQWRSWFTTILKIFWKLWRITFFDTLYIGVILSFNFINTIIRCLIY